MPEVMQQMPQHQDHSLDRWRRAVWVGVAIAFALTVLLLVGLVAYTLEVGERVFLNPANDDPGFAFSGISLITLTLLRLLAIFFGAALSFGGLVVSFFTHSQASQLSGAQGDAATGIKASLTTSSPGIAAIAVGAIVIIAALFARAEHDYEAPSESETTTTTTVTQPAASPPAEGRTAAAPGPAAKAKAGASAPSN